MKLPEWNSRLRALAIGAALIFVLNPEVRAVFLLVNAVGLDLIALMLLTQLRSLGPMIGSVFRGNGFTFCQFALKSTQATLSLMVAILWSKQIMAQVVHTVYLGFCCVRCLGAEQRS